MDGVDQLSELLPLLPVLVSLELLLSADNAIALAAIARGQKDPSLERRALNLGIGMAFGLRVALILLAQFVLAFPPFSSLQVFIFFGCVFVIFRIFQTSQLDSDELSTIRSRSFGRTVLTLAITDLAFSIDSVAAAVAISDQILLVVTGALIGVVALRFTSGLFIRWLQIYPRLETAGFLAVGFVGLKLLVLLALPSLHPSELVTFLSVMSLLIWGFSRLRFSASRRGLINVGGVATIWQRTRS